VKINFENIRLTQYYYPQIIGNTAMEDKGNPNSIKLPDTLEIFRNLKNAKQFAIDIGTLYIQNKF